jgi:hypothetical protein
MGPAGPAAVAGAGRWIVHWAKPLAGGAVVAATVLGLGVKALLGAVDPAHLRASYSQHFTLYGNGPDEVVPNVEPYMVRVASLQQLPAGSYLIWAKLFVQGANQGGSVRVTCELNSGWGAIDATTADVAQGGREPMALGVAVSYDNANNTAKLFCWNVSRQTRASELMWIKILAVGAGSLSNVESS